MDRQKTNSRQLTVAELQQSFGIAAEGTALNSNTSGKAKRSPYWNLTTSTALKDGSNMLSVPLTMHAYDRANGTQNRLMAYKDSLGEIQAVIMAIRPESAYLANAKGKVYLSSYTGHLLLFSTAQEFLRGYILEKGKIVGQLKLETMPSPQIDQNQVQAWEQECKWTHSYNYLNENGEIVVVAEKYCRDVWKIDPFVQPESIDPVEEGGGEGGATLWILEEIVHREIKLDTSITNNPKINCLMEKLLGKNGNTANPELMALLNAFVGKGFDVTFKIGTTKPNSRGEASENTSDPTKYNIILNTTKISAESQMSWVKTLLHEAFHVNLLQKTYALFGSTAINLWDKKPEEMSIDELMDYTSMKATASGNPILKAEHHDYMAANLDIIKEGLKSFSLANNPTSIHNTFTYYSFMGLAYDGLYSTSYYQKLTENADGSSKMVDFFGTLTALNSLYTTGGTNLQNDSILPCN